MDKYQKASSNWTIDSPLAEQFLEWEHWEDVVPLLPGDSQRIEYSELVIWPGPPPAGIPLQDIPRICDRWPHHRAFYVNKTGRYLTHQEANKVTGLSKEDRLLFFSNQPSEDHGWSDSHDETNTLLDTQESNNLSWLPGSPTWPTAMPAATFEAHPVIPGDEQQPENPHSNWRRLSPACRTANPYPRFVESTCC